VGLAMAALTSMCQRLSLLLGLEKLLKTGLAFHFLMECNSFACD
jgi:hypothetical protein